MSFKREGNDKSLLEKLRKRRINELFAEDIPEDEAKLLCNGRFTCTVCSSNPIFDTVNMLHLHRKGKKHLSNLEIHETKKRELKQLIAARRHQQYLKDGTTSLKMAVSNERGLLTSSPYDPRVKKVKVKRGERKPILDFATGSGISTGHSVDSHDLVTPAFATNVKDIKNGSSVLREAYEQCLSGPIKHDHQLKNIFNNKTVAPIRVMPYQSKFRKHQTTAKQYVDSASQSIGILSQAYNQNHTQEHNSHTDVLSSLHRGIYSTSSSKVSSHNTSDPTLTSGISVATQKPLILQCVPSSSLPFAVGSSIQSHKVLLGAAIPPPPPPPETSSCESTDTCTRISSVSSLPSASDKPLVNAKQGKLKEQSQMYQKLRQLQGSGWKRDWDGKWIKDDKAEFDSDEEPPDIP